MRGLLLVTVIGALLLAASICWSGIPHLIHYQGMLTDDEGTPLNTPQDLTFRIYNVESGGTLLWGETQNDVPMDNGLFSVILGSVTPIDLPFDQDYWLEIEVGVYDTLPRVRIASVGYAYRAEWADTTDHTLHAQRADTADWSDTSDYSLGAQRADTADYAISADTAAYAIAGGEGDGDWTFRITDTADTTLVTGGPWGVARSGNVLYGDADSTHVNFGVACTTGLSGQNLKYCTVAGGVRNTASGNHATVGGGERNMATGNQSTVGGGSWNTASGLQGTVAGGYAGNASGESATIGGGWHNLASGAVATVAGGQQDTASGDFATAAGGVYNVASGNRAAVVGGTRNIASGAWAFVGAGIHNTASGDYGTVGGGDNNTANGPYTTVGGGYYNAASFNYTTVAGGDTNTASGSRATVGGGHGNLVSGNYSTVGGGYNNAVTGLYSTIAGGHRDTVESAYSFAAGSEVKIATGANHTFAFGHDFTTSSASSVIFHDAVTPIKVGIGTTSPTGQLDVNGDDIRIRSSQTPASSSADGYTGEIAWDAGHIYICTSGDGPGGGTDTWKRVALTTF